jgi:hypothetical protein
VGNRHDYESHRKHAHQKRVEMRTQVEIFQPALFVPFASFIYFSHAENFFMNRAINRIADVYEFTTHELKVSTVELYPGDRWQVGTPRDSSESIASYELDFARALAGPPDLTQISHPTSWLAIGPRTQRHSRHHGQMRRPILAKRWHPYIWFENCLSSGCLAPMKRTVRCLDNGGSLDLCFL